MGVDLGLSATGRHGPITFVNNGQVEDDGQGFEVDTPVALNRLLEQQRFGLAGTFECAHLHLESAPGQGTQVWAVWPAAHAQTRVINHTLEHHPENTASH